MLAGARGSRRRRWLLAWEPPSRLLPGSRPRERILALTRSRVHSPRVTGAWSSPLFLIVRASTKRWWPKDSGARPENAYGPSRTATNTSVSWRLLVREAVENWPEFRPVELLKRLVAHGVDFVVVGAIALVAHGSARTTSDLDICYAMDSENLEALGAALIELGAKLRAVQDDVPFVPDSQTLRRTTILTLSTQEGNVDLLVRPAGSPPYEHLRTHAERVTVDGVAVLIASLGDLEAMKRAAGRPKDQIDLEEIEVIRRLRD